jgi:anaphase-promoting complex subunit 1
LPPSPFQFRPQYPSDNGRISIPPWLRLSAVDTRLVLESTVNGAVEAAFGHGNGSDEVKDRLWQLRLLFDWVDRELDADKENDITQKRESSHNAPSIHKEQGLWLKRDIIEEARWKIWGVQVGESISKA